MFKICRIIKYGGSNSGRVIPSYGVQTVSYYDRPKTQRFTIHKKRTNSLSKSIRKEIQEINSDIKENQDILKVEHDNQSNVDHSISEDQQLEDQQQQQQDQQDNQEQFNIQSDGYWKKKNTNKFEPFKIISYQTKMVEGKQYKDSLLSIRKDFKPDEIVKIDNENYPMDKLPFTQFSKDQADYIQNLIYRKGIQNAIIEFHNSLPDNQIANSEVNFFSFSFLLTSIALENGIEKSVEYFKYYINQQYKPFLCSHRFLYYLRLIYKYNPNSVETIYKFLLASNLIDIKMTFYFCTFYLEVGEEDKSINLINNNFKKQSIINNNNNDNNNNNNNIKLQQQQQQQQSDYQDSSNIKQIENIWDFNLNGQLLYLNEQVLTKPNGYSITTNEYHKILNDLNKLFATSSGYLRFYSVLSELFLPNGKITSKVLIPSFIKFANSCLHSKREELLDVVFSPYIKPDISNPSTTTAQLMGMVYFYSNNRSLLQLKKYIYDKLLLSISPNTSWKFRETLLNTLIYCNLEANDYNEALRSLDIKKHILYLSKCKNYERIDHNNNMLDPFIGFHHYLSTRVISNENEPFKERHLNSRDFWRSKQNQTIKITPPPPKQLKPTPSQSSSQSPKQPQSSLNYPKYSPYEATTLIKETDQLLSIKKQEGSFLRFPRTFITKSYLSELSSSLSKLNSQNSTTDEQLFEKNILALETFYLNLNNTELFKYSSDTTNASTSDISTLGNFYFNIPHSSLFYDSIQQFRKYYSKNNEMLEKYFRFVSKLAKPMANLFTVPNDWYQYLFANPNVHGLTVMTECLPSTVYRSADFYNFWLHKISEFKKPAYLNLSWKLVEYMLSENIPFYRKPLLTFSDYIFKSNQLRHSEDQDEEEFDAQLELLEQNGYNQSFESLLERIEINNHWLESDILNVLKWKLKLFPTNDYSRECIFSCNKIEINNVYNESLKSKVITPTLVELQIQLLSRLHPIPPISNFQNWLDIGKTLHNECLITFTRTICQCLVRLKQFQQLETYLDSNINMIGSLSISVIQEIFQKLSPIKQVQYIYHIREFTSYKPSFIQYIKDLKLSLLSNSTQQNDKFLIDNPHLILKLDKLISKERLSDPNIKTTLDQQQKEFEQLFIKLYLIK